MTKHLTLLLFIGLAWGQDKIVTVKLKNGEAIRGKILHGKDLNDYYVRLLTQEKKIKDIYTVDIVSVKDTKPLKKTLSAKPEVGFIPYDDPPVAMSPIRPTYPEFAQEDGIEGVVVVQVFIDEKGRVKETLILTGVPNSGLNEAAMESIRKTRFRPAKQREKPVGVWISIPVNFKLK